MNTAISRIYIKLLWLCFVLFLANQTHAAEPVCAVVKIEIAQELTLERQAFEAQMKINNALDSMPLENVSIVVNFQDEVGNTVVASSNPSATNAKFFIRVDSMDKVTDINGGGSIAPATTADVRWLIIPAPGAALDNPLGSVYFVGATLSYTVAGEVETVTVAPDRIVVKPLPLLTLDYFLERHVFADDAFTAQIEPAEPFTLGVRVSNNGKAAAKNIKIDSAQPKIVENKQGLLIGFDIISSFLGNQQAAPTLLLDFGNIDANSAKAGRWQMVTTLSGEFIDFSASFTHADELGGALTSILQAANTHFLIHDVLVDLPGRDAVLDFFADDGDALRVYESENIDSVVTDQSASATFDLLSADGSEHVYSLTLPPSSGFLHVKLADGFAGSYRVEQVVRADGKIIPLANAWFSKQRNATNGFDHFINLFDVNNTSGQYFFTLRPKVEIPVAPVLQFIGDRTVSEGEQAAFLVQASDGNKTVPTISANPLPAGATFSLSDTTDQIATYVFDWIPSANQAGDYEITYTATDGEFNSRRTARIKVTPAGDTDGDGMDDQWELENFGTLDRDGTGDFDGDGISDLDEFLAGTNPRAHVPVKIPGRVEAELVHAYFDTTLGNQGDKQCGVDNFDAQITTDVDGNCHIFNTATNEWTEYQVDVATAGWFDMVLRLASADANAVVYVEIDGVDVTGSQRVPQTATPTFANITVPVELTAGVHTVRVLYEAGSVNFNYLDFLASAGPANEPPVVHAGADTRAVVGTPLTLAGTVTDDGRALPMSVSWMPTAGVAFADVTNPKTTATFSQSGQYTLTLTADDTEFAVSATVVITVTDGATNAAPVVDAGANAQVVVGQPLTLTGSVTDDGFTSPLTTAWSPLTGAEFVNANDPATSVTFATTGEYVLTLTANDTELTVADTVVITVVEAPLNAAPVVDAGANAQVKVGQLLALAGTVTDDGLTTPLTASWTALADVVFSDINSPTSNVSFTVPGEYLLTLNADDTEFSVNDTVLITVIDSQTNTAPVVQAGADAQVTVGQPLTLAGSVSDDGVASPLIVEWTPVMDVSFADANNPATAVTFAAPGEYVLTLTANDSEFTVVDTVIVTVVSSQSNAAPVAHAGADMTVQVGQPVALGGSVVDDGLAVPLTIGWTAVTGAEFVDPTSPTTTVTFSSPGEYVLTLVADDTEFQTADTVTVVVTDVSVQSVLYVGITVPLNTGDTAAAQYLEQLGYTVYPVDQDTVMVSDADGMDLVVISGTVHHSNIDSMFRNVAIPVLTWEPYIYDDLGMTAATAGSYGRTAFDQNHITLAGNHSLTNGLLGSKQVVTYTQYISWGVPGGDAIIAAHLVGDATRATIFGYEAGALLADGTAAAARRVGFFLDRGAAGSWTANGQLLFEAAVKWALKPSDTNQPPRVVAGPDTRAAVGMPLSLDGWVTDDGKPGPLTVTWSTVAGAQFADTSDPATRVTFDSPGVYELTLSGSDSTHTVTDSITVTVHDPVVSPAVLYVGIEVPLNTGDTAAAQYLEQLGYTVYPVDQDTVSVSDSNGMSLVVISGTVHHSNIDGMFRNVEIPVITWEPYIYDDLGMTAATDGSYGRTAADQNHISLVGNHSLTGGLSGSNQVVTYEQYISWGVPGGDAIVAAHLVGDATKATLFGYEAGARLADGTVAPAKRIGLFLDRGAASSWTANGQLLFEAAINWALTPSNTNQPPRVVAGPDTRAAVGMPLSLEGWVTDDSKPAPLTATWSAVAGVEFANASDPSTHVTFASPGEYVLTLTGSDSVYTITDSVTVTVHDPAISPAVLYVGVEVPLNTGDTAAAHYLEQLGYTVYPADDDTVAIRDANGMSFVVVSGTVHHSNIDGMFRDIQIPLVTWEPYIYDDLGMTAATAGSYGRTAADQNHITMVGSHSLTSGLSGSQQVVTYNQYISWGVPGGDAIVAAHLVDDATKATIFGYEAGALLADGTVAAAKRVGLFLDRGAASSWTANGQRLFEAAISWALTPSDVNQPPRVAAGPDTRAAVGMPLSLEGWVTDDGKTSPLTAAWSAVAGAQFTDTSDPATHVTFDAAGEYVLTLSGSDSVHTVTDSITVTVHDPVVSPAVLYVGVEVPLNTGDTAAAQYLEQLGYTVYPVDDDAVTVSDINGVSFVVVSGTVHHSNINGMFRDVEIPVVTWEPYIYDDLGMTAATAGSYGRTAFDQNHIMLVGNHSLTGGLLGSNQVVKHNQYISWGVPGGDAIVAAHVVGDATKATIFGYEAGALLADGTVAAAKRVGFFLDRGAASSWTANGQRLFEAAISWALTPSDANQPPRVVAGPDTRAAVGMPLSLEGWVTDDGKPSPLTVAWSTIAGAQFTSTSDPATRVTFDSPGEYVLTLSGSDSVHTVTDSITVTVHDPAVSPAVLYVGVEVPLNTGDTAAAEYLEQLGYTVYPVDDDTVIKSDINGMSFVLVSGTVHHSKINGIFRDIEVPIITWETHIYDDMGMTAATAGSYGRTAFDQNYISMVGSHALTGGFSGDVQVVTYTQYISWGVPGGDAVVAAHVVGDATKATLFGYEAGTLLADGTVAPAKRIGFFFDGGAASSWTADGKSLFEAAVSWAMTPSSTQ